MYTGEKRDDIHELLLFAQENERQKVIMKKKK